MIISDVKIKGDLATEILSNPKFQKEVERQVKNQFNARKESALDQFEKHPVTKELSNPEAGNISNTLGGYGDLFGFIGFEEGFDPIEPVREALESKIKYLGTNISIVYPRNARGQFATGKQSKAIFIKVQVPEINDFDDAAQFQGWNGGRNWVKGIERGISGAPYFADYPRGRSGRGLQLKGVISKSKGPAISFKTVQYITQIVNNFLNNFSKT